MFYVSTPIQAKIFNPFLTFTEKKTVHNAITTISIYRDVRRMMTEIFSIVETELSQLVAFGEELDPLNSLNMLVVIGQKVAQAQQVEYVYPLFVCNLDFTLNFIFINY